MPVSPVATPTSPLDTTGRAAEDRARSGKKAKQEQNRITTINAQAEAEELANGVFEPLQQTPVILDEVEEVGVTLADDSVIIRTIVDIDEMTYGVGTLYTFKQGVKYKVPRGLANYLTRLGYTWQA